MKDIDTETVQRNFIKYLNKQKAKYALKNWRSSMYSVYKVKLICPGHVLMWVTSIGCVIWQQNLIFPLSRSEARKSFIHIFYKFPRIWDGCSMKSTFKIRSDQLSNHSKRHVIWIRTNLKEALQSALCKW